MVVRLLLADAAPLGCAQIAPTSLQALRSGIILSDGWTIGVHGTHRPEPLGQAASLGREP